MTEQAMTETDYQRTKSSQSHVTVRSLTDGLANLPPDTPVVLATTWGEPQACMYYIEGGQVAAVAIHAGELTGARIIIAEGTKPDEREQKAEAYDDAVRAWHEMHPGRPLSTTLGSLIRSGCLSYEPVDGGNEGDYPRDMAPPEEQG